MKRLKHNKRFTLIEVILTIIIVMLVATVFSTLLSDFLLEAPRQMENLRAEVHLQNVMERITASHLGSLESLSNSVGNEGVSQSNSFGNYIVIHNKFIKFDNLGDEQEIITGTDSEDLLKLTIKQSSSLQISTLFIE